MKPEIVQIKYRDIKNKNTKLNQVLNEHQVEFQYDQATGEYVALLDLKKQKPPIPKRDRDYTLTRHRPNNRDYHPDCRSNSIKRRPFTGNATSRSVKRFVEPEKRKQDRPISMTAMKTYNIINENKQNILKDFQHLFPQLDFYNIKSAPILIGIRFICRKMEFFYNKQFEAVLRVKSSTAIDLAQVIYDYYQSKYKDSKLYLTQAIADLLYTVFKYREQKEVGIFYEFLMRDRDNDSFVFYIYIRQNFKFITYNYFMSHKSTEKDPRELTITRDKASDIVMSAFYFSEPAALAIKAAIFESTKNRKLISYYGFMVACIEAKISYKGMDLISRCLSLYNFRNNPDMYNVEQEPKVDPSLTYHYHKAEAKKLLYESTINRAKQISRMARTEKRDIDFDRAVGEIRIMDVDRKDSAKKVMGRDTLDLMGDTDEETGAIKFDLFQVNNVRDALSAFMAPSYQRSKSDMELNQVDLDYIEDLSNSRINRKKSRSERDTIVFHKPKHQTFNNTADKLSKVYENEYDDLNDSLKLSLKSLIKDYIYNFCEDGSIKIEGLEVLQQTCEEMFYAKALKILTMLLQNDKLKFFELLRADPAKNTQTLFFWREMTGLYYEYKINEDILNYTDIETFVQKILCFSPIKKELDFLLGYQLGVEITPEPDKKPAASNKQGYYKGFDNYMENFGSGTNDSKAKPTSNKNDLLKLSGVYKSDKNIKASQGSNRIVKNPFK